MNRHVGTGVAQRILIALELRLKRVVSEPLIARKGPQLCLGTPGTRAEEVLTCLPYVKRARPEHTAHRLGLRRR